MNSNNEKKKKERPSKYNKNNNMQKKKANQSRIKLVRLFDVEELRLTAD